MEPPKIDLNYNTDIVIKSVSDYYNLNESELKKKDRHWHIRTARQVCMYLLKRNTTMSLVAIGKLFKRDHTTVIHSVQKVKDLLDTEEAFRIELFRLTSIIDSNIYKNK